MLGLGELKCNWLGGRLNDRLGSARTLKILCVGQVVMPSAVLVPADAGRHSRSHGLCVVKLRLVLHGRPADTPRPANPRARQSVVLALNAAAIYIGASLGSFIGGQVLKAWGIDALGLAAAAAMVFAFGHLLVSERVKLRG